MQNDQGPERHAAGIAMSRLAAIVESSDDAIIGKDLNGIITSWNRGAEKIFGYTADEMVGITTLRLIPEDRREEENYILDMIRRGEKVDHYETVRQAKDGRRIDVSITASPIKDAAGNIVGMSKISRDITMLKAHQQEIIRVSRLYAALSQINQAIVWTRHRDELFGKICRVLVEFGKFRLAWIGMSDAKGQRVHPVAQWGDETNYLAEAAIYADDRPEGRGPMGTAVREGKHYVCNDFAQDPCTVPWREAANRAGFRAAAAFPIRQRGAVCGGVIVYSGEIGFFRDMEVALLEEAATDVSFALDFLAQEEERQQAEQAMRASEERYRALFDRSLDCVFLNDFAGNFLDANQATLDLLGYQRADIATVTFASLLPEDQLPLAFQVTEEIKTTGHQKRPAEFRLRSKDGREVHVETRSSLIYREGKPFAIQGIARDLTGRKQTEQALRENEEKFSKIFQCSPMGLALSTIDEGRYLDANQAFLNILQRSRAEVIGHTAAELDIWENPEQRAAMIAQRDGLGAVHNVELRIRGRLGRTSAILWSAETVVIAGKNCLLGLSLDITRRKQAEDERDRLFNLSLDLLCVAGFDGQLQQVNPAWTECLGWTAEELTSRPMLDFILPEDHEATRRVREKIYQGVPVRGFENRYRCKDGSYRWLSWTVHPLMESRQVFSVARDITERKQALEKLKENEAGLAEAQRIAKLGNWQYDLARNEVRWSDELHRIFEIERTQSNGTHEAFLNCVIPEDRPKVRQANAEAVAGGTSFEVEYRIQTRAGGLKHIREVGYALKDAAGKVVGLFGTAQDITEQKRAEESLRLLNSAVMQARESVVITDAQLDSPGPKIVFVNPAFTQMTGYSAEEVIGKTPRILQGPRTDKNVLSRLRKNLERGEVFEGEAIQYRKDGTEYDQEWQIAPLRDGRGKITHFVAIQRDISAQRKLEAQLRQSQKMEAFGQLAGGVAHDFNNILAVIQLQAGILKTESNLSLQQLDLAGEIEKASERGANLTRQLLLFSRKQTMQPRNLKLKDVVENITKMLQRTLGEQFELQFKFSDKPLAIHADPGMIDQILLNLTVNARDAMPKGGRIIIETKAVEFDEVTAIQTAKASPGSFVCVSVTDTGCGIPPEILPRIFEPFFTTKEVGKGTGLGLATVFGIVQQHKGWINVYSEVGRGTTFRVYLPRLTDASDTRFIRASLASIRGGSETILLVEDEAPLRAAVRTSLSRLGYRVLEAATGNEALAVWKRHSGEIHLLLTDMVMPGGMSGKELAEALLQQDPKLNVIYASGYSAEIAGRDFLVEEDINFLTKPFQTHKLAQIIRDKLDKPV
jgi:PAS domain S-box-containing protein